MELLIGFGRLPDISRGKGKDAKPIQFFSQIAPMQPFDTLLMTIQKNTLTLMKVQLSCPLMMRVNN